METAPADALDRLHGLLLQFASRERIKPGLARIRALCAELGEPQRRFPAVHVAGSNGKGSVASLVSAALLGAGVRVGLYTSPHLVRWSERIQVDAKEIPLPRFVESVERLFEPARRIGATVFELTTAVAFDHFAREGVELAVVETGLGGRFDATNLVAPWATAVTGVSLEHTDTLGSTLAQIAWEKAGIAKVGVPMVCAPLDPEALAVVRAVCQAVGAPLHEVAPLPCSGFDWTQQTLEHPRWGALRLPLLGAYQARNAAVAVALLERVGPRLGRDPQAWLPGLAAARWPGRFEVVSRAGLCVLDGAHNPEGARALRESLERYAALLPDAARRWLLFGIRRDKDHAGVTRDLFPWFDRILLSPLVGMPGLDPAQLLPYAQQHDPEARTFDAPATALAHAQSSRGSQDLLCVTGSLSLVGEVRWRLCTDAP